MRFALIGNDPDGIQMAAALAESGRHEWAAYTVPLSATELPTASAAPRRIADTEEVLADSSIELILVAGPLALRPQQLRRAIQSEHHVLCVYPPDLTPEAAYEAAMIQEDTGLGLLPLLPHALHPGVLRLGALVRQSLGQLVLLQGEITSSGEILTGLDEAAPKAAFPGWEVLRTIGGEIDEVSAFAPTEELQAGEAVLVSGRFAQGGLLQMTLLPQQPSSQVRFIAVGRSGRAELYLPQSWDGPAFLTFSDAAGQAREEAWDRWDPWLAFIEPVEAAAGRRDREAPVSWQDAIRGLELDDAARRSVQRRRASALEYPEPTEETGFKGTMTLVGCSLVWGVLLLLILWNWWPPARFLIAPLLLVFLALQLLRYLIPRQAGPTTDHPSPVRQQRGRTNSGHTSSPGQSPAPQEFTTGPRPSPSDSGPTPPAV